LFVIPNEVGDLQFVASKATLQDSLNPVPGELKIIANLPGSTVEITQLENVKESENALDFVSRGRPRPRPLTLGGAAREVSKKSQEGDDRGIPPLHNRRADTRQVQLRTRIVSAIGSGC
jgi:hypothetical protein